MTSNKCINRLRWRVHYFLPEKKNSVIC